MSVKMMGLVWDADHIDRKKKYVLLAYADHADHEGNNIFPAVATVARKTGYSERNIQRITQELVDDKYLIEEGKGPKGTNKYSMNIEKIGGDNLSGVTKRQGDKTTRGGDKAMSPEPSLEPSFKDAGAARRERLKKLVDPYGIGIPGIVPADHNKPDLSWVPEPYLEYARAFVTTSGITPIKKDETLWVKTFHEWMERGFNSAHIVAAVRKNREDNLTIKGPQSVTANAIDIKANGAQPATTERNPTMDRLKGRDA